MYLATCYQKLSQGCQGVFYSDLDVLTVSLQPSISKVAEEDSYSHVHRSQADQAQERPAWRANGKKGVRLAQAAMRQSHSPVPGWLEQAGLRHHISALSKLDVDQFRGLLMQVGVQARLSYECKSQKGSPSFAEETQLRIEAVLRPSLS